MMAGQAATAVRRPRTIFGGEGRCGKGYCVEWSDGWLFLDVLGLDGWIERFGMVSGVGVWKGV